MSLRNPAGVIGALIFAVAFGAVGLFASWAIGSTLAEAFAARDWVKVRAQVMRYDGGGVLYQYRLGDREYSGSKLSVGLLEPSEVDGEVDARLMASLNEKKPATVFVNPANPAQSVVDPAIPWMLVVGLSPFALAFGGVGLAALFVAWRQALPEPAEEKSTRIESDAGGGLLVMWIFTLLWNAIAFPIAILVLAQALSNGEWGALFVLLFPLIGALLLLGAVVGTWKWIRRGGATIRLQEAPARLGRLFAGTVVFARGVDAGETFRAKLACVTPGHVNMLAPNWSTETTARVSDGPQGKQLALRLDVPARLPESSGIEADEMSHWRIELYRPESSAAAYGFDFTMQPDPAAALDANVDGDEEDEDEAQGEDAFKPGAAAAPSLPPEVDKLMQVLGQPDGAESRKRIAVAMRQLTPEQQQALAKAASWAPRIKKIVIGFVVVVVAFQIIGVVVALGFSR